MAVKKRVKPPTTDIDAWLLAIGLNRHQWAEGASLLGLTHSQAHNRNNSSNRSQWKKAEKLAMTAVWLGLPEFSIDLYNLPEDRRATILAAATVIRRAMGLTEPEPDPGEAPSQ